MDALLSYRDVETHTTAGPGTPARLDPYWCLHTHCFTLSAVAIQSREVAAAMSMGPPPRIGSVYAPSCCSAYSLPAGIKYRKIVASLPSAPATTAHRRVEGHSHPSATAARLEAIVALLSSAPVWSRKKSLHATRDRHSFDVSAIMSVQGAGGMRQCVLLAKCA